MSCVAKRLSCSRLILRLSFKARQGSRSARMRKNLLEGELV